MPRSRLTAAAVERIAAPDRGRIELLDEIVPQLALRVTSKGAKSYVLRTRIHGRQIRLTLGRHPGMTLAEAREAARDALLKAQRGIDIRQEQIDHQREDQRRRSNTFEVVAEEFVERYVKRRGNRTWRETKRILDKYVVPYWRGIPITEIGRRDVVDLLDRVEDRHGIYMANRTLAAVRKLFNWALAERGLVETTPIVPGMARGKEKSRERYLRDDEIKAIWDAAAAKGYPFGPIVQLLLLTGQRRAEVAGMLWSHIDLEARTWTIPAEATKAGRRHIVPLSQSALQVLAGLPRVHDAFVFTTTGETVVSGFSQAKKDLSRRSGVEDWRLHDLRATVATLMEERLRIPPHVIGSVLNHDPKGYKGITGTYTRGDILDERRRALDAWAELVEQIAYEGAHYHR